MPKTRAQKEDLVKYLTDKLGKAKSVVFADYQGLSMAQLSELRIALKESGAQFLVTKNNLLKLALKNSHSSLSPNHSSLFEGPIATLFAYEDEISPLKALAKAFKDFQMGKIKLGILDGEILDSVTINQLAQLPAKDELRAKLVGSLGAPLYGIVAVCQANLRNLVYALEQIRVSRGGV